jgi:hypothetical protein
VTTDYIVTIDKFHLDLDEVLESSSYVCKYPDFESVLAHKSVLDQIGKSGV